MGPDCQVPNGLGALFGMAQLILYATYYKSTKRQIEARKSKETVLSEVNVVAANQQPKKSANASTENGGAYENHGT